MKASPTQLFASLGGTFTEGVGIRRVGNSGQPAQECENPAAHTAYRDEDRRQNCENQEYWRAGQIMAKLNLNRPQMNCMQLCATLAILKLRDFVIQRSN